MVSGFIVRDGLVCINAVEVGLVCVVSCRLAKEAWLYHLLCANIDILVLHFLRSCSP